MELKRLLTRATALLLQGAYQGAEYFIEQAMAEADKLKQDLAEIDTLRTRVTEMASEVERLQSVIDEASAQEPIRYLLTGKNGELVGKLFMTKESAENYASSMLVGDLDATPVFIRPVPAQQSPVTAIDERTNEFGEPETVYLQLHGPDDGNEKSHGSNYKADGVTWCWHPINENDVRYIRADLFQQSPAVAVPDGYRVQIDNDGSVHVLCDDSKTAIEVDEPLLVRYFTELLLPKAAALPSPRITEQDAREIVTAWAKHVDDHDETVAIPDFEWSHHEWKPILRSLLNKLNNKNNIPN